MTHITNVAKSMVEGETTTKKIKKSSAASTSTVPPLSPTSSTSASSTPSDSSPIISPSSSSQTKQAQTTVANTQNETSKSIYDSEFRAKVYAHVGKYARPNLKLALYNLFASFIVFLSWYALPSMWRWILFPIHGLCRVRLFMTFHDMGHQSYFGSKFANDTIGTWLSGTVTTPYKYWVRGHNHHHKHSNNLDRKQYSQNAPWTVNQYNAQSRWGQLAYNFIYGPITFWTVIPFLFFLVVLRFFSTIPELISHFGFQYIIYLFLGWEGVAQEYASLYWSAWVGFFLFSVQHTFDGAYKRVEKEWDYFDNGMRGSSFFQVPWFLKWFTFGIEYHHIHHLNARVPAYNMRQCHEDGIHLFKNVPHVSLWQAIKYMPYSIWNEDNEMFENVYRYLKTKSV